MSRTTSISRLLVFSLCLALSFQPVLPARAADGQEKVEQKDKPASALPEQAAGAATQGQQKPENAPAVQAEPGVLLPIQPHDAPVTLSFNGVPLYDFINAVASQLGLNYVVDPNVSGTVTIKTDKPIRKKDLLEVFQQILKMNNATIVRGASGLYHIVPLGQASKIPMPVYKDYGLEERKEKGGGEQNKNNKKDEAKDQPDGAALLAPVVLPTGAPVQAPPQAAPEQPNEFATYIIPIEFLTSTEMANLIKPFLSDQTTVIDYPRSNLLIVSDFKSNVDRLVQIIRALDGRSFEEESFDLIKIKYYSAAEILDILKKIFGGGKDQAAGINFIPIEHLNSILVIANSARALEEVRRWVERLDTPQGRSMKIFIYHVQNSLAANIAATLSQLFSETPGIGATAAQPATPFGQPQQQQSGLAQPQAGPRGVGGQRAGFGTLAQGGTQMRGQQLGPRLQGQLGGVQQAELTSFESRVKLVVDELNNALIIQASEADYEFLLETIKQLDVLPRQVLIDAKIFEVNLTDNISLGVLNELTKRNDSDNLTTAISGVKSQGDSPLGFSTFQIIGDARELVTALTAGRFKSRAKVLQAPSILALDGHEARITVGAEIPVTTGTFSDPLQGGDITRAPTLNTIQFRDTGTTLIINPRINASGMVTMEIAQEVSSPSGGGLTPTINKTAVNTVLTVKDGETVVIGGILSESRINARNRVPVLGDIPVIGALFGTTNRDLTRREIIIMLTPRVIRRPEEHLEVSSDFRATHRDANRMSLDFERDFKRLIREAQEKRRALETQKQEKQ